MLSMDPLAPFDRQEHCWCGSGKTYRLCHKQLSKAQSVPGEPVPADNEGKLFLSPKVSMDRALIPKLFPAGTPLRLPPENLSPTPTRYSALDEGLSTFKSDEAPLSPQDAGGHRVFLLERLAELPETDEAVHPEIAESIVHTSLLAWQTAQSLAKLEPKPTVLWNEDLDPLVFISRTILLSDHVLTPDRLITLVANAATSREIAKTARAELQYRHLSESGRILMVPSGLGRFLNDEMLQESTRRDLSNARLVDFVASQLVVEGPTARDALFIRAIDDVAKNPFMWFHGRIQKPEDDAEDGRFSTRFLGDYDAQYDYSAWIAQCTREAVSRYVQRTTERLGVSELIGAEYVATTPFEARLLRHRSPDANAGIGSASVWAEIPTLTDLHSRDLAKLLDNDEAVEDFRERIRLAMATSSEFLGQIQAVQSAAAGIESAAKKLERNMKTNRVYSGILPALAGGLGVVIGSTAGPLGTAGALLAGAAGLTPYFGTRKTQMREAPYLFLTAQRRKRKRR
ncbi:SEC-C domain-containing protein [Leucobacter aridicollis]|nr:SEC-C domain-containing protein [Leucobacter aridicollis]